MKHCPSTNGPWKTYRLDHLPPAHACVSVREIVSFDFYEQEGIVYSKFVTSQVHTYEQQIPALANLTDLALDGGCRIGRQWDCDIYWKWCEEVEGGMQARLANGHSFQRQTCKYGPKEETIHERGGKQACECLCGKTQTLYLQL